VVGTVARTAVVAGTATAVVGAVSGKQQANAAQAADAEAFRQQQQAAAMQPAAGAAVAPPAPAGADAQVSQLVGLAQLHQQGVLTAEEFAAKAISVLGL